MTDGVLTSSDFVFTDGRSGAAVYSGRLASPSVTYGVPPILHLLARFQQALLQVLLTDHGSTVAALGDQFCKLVQVSLGNLSLLDDFSLRVDDSQSGLGILPITLLLGGFLEILNGFRGVLRIALS